MTKLTEYFNSLDSNDPKHWIEWHVPLKLLRSLLQPTPDKNVNAMLNRFNLACKLSANGLC